MAYPTIKRGSTGSAVTTLQWKLRYHGHSLTVDGKFGPGTESVVKKFQASRKLTADGVVGEKTWQHLMAGPTLRRGASGHYVTYAQTRLGKHGISTTIDGKFGPGTEAAVKKFQSAKKLTADGVIGRTTWDALHATPTATTAPTANYTAEAKSILAYLGWRVNTTARFWQAVRDFQRMWNLGTALSVDGKVGPKTIAALRLSKSRKAAGKGDISANFSAVEFRCKCGGRYANCRRIWAHRNLVRACEKYRGKYGPFTPISACRCDSHNAAVGGYVYSQHRYGNAVDLIPEGTANGVQALGVASGIGIQRATGRVRHIDLRHLGPKNYPYATLSSPRRYYYG
jgi:peptidoglycan hydrolase-like protein with peptidoglycan-binding domain